MEFYTLRFTPSVIRSDNGLRYHRATMTVPRLKKLGCGFTGSLLLMVAELGSWANPVSSVEGTVVGVSDGDTVTVLLNDKQPLKVRLQGVDAPEKHQPFGEKAKSFTSEQLYGKRVRVEVVTHDRYGRTIGRVFLGTVGLDEALVGAGLAWWYRQFDPKNETLKRLEAEARLARRGLWAEANPIAPWDWRRNQSQRLPKALHKTENKSLGNPPTRIENTSKSTDLTHPIYGNSRSRIAHRYGCKDYQCKFCTTVFSTEAMMKQAGYRPHKQCFK